MRFLLPFTFGLLLSFASCIFGPPPGKGAKAEAGFRDAAPIISALERFRGDQGHYPKTLQELVPRYMPNASAFNRERRYSGFTYQHMGAAYTLQFSYEGPGMNHCRYDSRTRRWDSSGYY